MKAYLRDSVYYLLDQFCIKQKKRKSGNPIINTIGQPSLAFLNLTPLMNPKLDVLIYKKYLMLVKTPDTTKGITGSCTELQI